MAGAPSRHRSAVALATASLTALLAALLTACGDEPASVAAQAESEVVGSVEPSPFEVVDPPEGYRLVRADEATGPVTWGSEDVPSDEPFVVLAAPDDEERLVAVSTFALPGDVSDDVAVVLRAGGEIGGYQVDASGTYETGTDEMGAEWSEVVAAVDGVGIRVSSTTVRPKAELLAWARSVRAPEDRTAAPDVSGLEALDGLEVVGTVSAPVIRAFGDGDLRYELSPDGAWVQLWQHDGGGTLVVRTLAGRAADLDAIGEHPWLGVRRVDRTEIGGRPAVHLERCPTYGDDPCRPALATTTSWGDLVTIVAGGDGDLDVSDLDAVAASVTEVDLARWDDLRTEAFGGTTPDPGERVLAEGEVEGLSWILQSATGEDASSFAIYGEIVEVGIDPCLKFSDAVRRCVGGASFGRDASGRSSVVGGVGSERSLLTLLVVRGHPEEATSVRIVGPEVTEPSGATRPALDLTVALQPTPAGGGRFAVLPVDVGISGCADPDDLAEIEDLPQIAHARVALVDDAGTEVSCLGGP